MAAISRTAAAVKALSVLVVLALLPGPLLAADWPQEPTTYRGVAWLTPRDDVRAKKALKLKWAPWGGVRRYRHFASYLARGTFSVPGLRGTELWWFDKADRFVMATWIVQPHRYSFVLGILSATYGPPHSSIEGVDADLWTAGRADVWEGRRVRIELKRFIGAAGPTAHVNFRWLEDLEAEEAEEKKAGSPF